MKYLPFALLLFAAPAAAQTPLVAGQLIEFDLATPGTRVVGTTSSLRPEANIAFEYRLDGAATPIAAVKASACINGPTAPALICRLVPPVLAAGTHTIEIRALPSPAETGVSPSAYGSPLSVVMLIVTSPGVPSAARVITVP